MSKSSWQSKSAALISGIVLVLLTVTVPPALAGQDLASGPSADMSDERLEAFTIAWIAINEVRNDLHNRFARDHAVRGRQEIREEADREIEEILEANGLTGEDFAEFNRLVGVDPGLRDRFDEMVQRLADS